jgi:hypothetical protein
LFREICEAYTGLTPADLEELTFDQLFILSAKKTVLARMGGIGTFGVDDARQLGIVKSPAPRPGEPQSQVQRIRAAKAAERERMTKLSKRERRREFDRQLKEKRARGEV